VRMRGISGSIARQNAMRNPKRTAGTASSLMIGVALVSFLAIFAASIKSSGAAVFRDDFRGTAIVDSGSVDGSGGFSPALAADIRTLPGVRTVTEQRIVPVEIDGSSHILSAYDSATVATLFDLGRVNGDLSELGTDGIAVEADIGSDKVHLGDVRTITFPTRTAAFIVRATYEHGASLVGSQFVDLRAFEANLPWAIDSRIYIDVDSLALVDRASAAYPTAKVLTTEAFISEQNASIDPILTLVYALLGVAVVIALLGIANTLVLSIHERKRELGLLRAVGMARAQVRASVRWESAIIALFGTFLGLTVGTFLGWAMVDVLAEQGVEQLAIPVGTLLTVTAIAAIAGVAAALLPAHRAAGIDILKAVASP
jgi:putative ABC transport system permease protein